MVETILTALPVHGLTQERVDAAVASFLAAGCPGLADYPVYTRQRLKANRNIMSRVIFIDPDLADAISAACVANNTDLSAGINCAMDYYFNR